MNDFIVLLNEMHTDMELNISNGYETMRIEVVKEMLEALGKKYAECHYK